MAFQSDGEEMEFFFLAYKKYFGHVGCSNVSEI